MAKFYLLKDKQEVLNVPTMFKQDYIVELKKEELIAIHTLIQIPNKNVDIPLKCGDFVRVETDKICDKIRGVLGNE